MSCRSVPIVRAASVMSASQFGERIPPRQGFAAPFLSRQHVVDKRAAVQNALLLTPECVDSEADDRQGVRAETWRASPCSPRRESVQARIRLYGRLSFSVYRTELRHETTRGLWRRMRVAVPINATF